MSVAGSAPVRSSLARVFACDPLMILADVEQRSTTDGHSMLELTNHVTSDGAARGYVAGWLTTAAAK